VCDATEAAQRTTDDNIKNITWSKFSIGSVKISKSYT
jgi:hypothetical protein